MGCVPICKIHINMRLRVGSSRWRARRLSEADIMVGMATTDGPGIPVMGFPSRHDSPILIVIIIARRGAAAASMPGSGAASS